MDTMHIASYPIKLDQFLKLANVVASGCEAKALLQSDRIRVNGSIERRRGRKLFKKDRIDLDDGTSFLLA